MISVDGKALFYICDQFHFFFISGVLRDLLLKIEITHGRPDRSQCPLVFVLLLFCQRSASKSVSFRSGR